MEKIVHVQIEAYNARDLDAFVATYSPEIVIEDGEGNVLMQGHDALREQYGALFDASPELNATIVNRIIKGQYVVYEESVTGIGVEGYPNEVHGIVIYRVENDKIIHVRLIQ